MASERPAAEEGPKVQLAGLTAGQLADLIGATSVAYVLNAGPAEACASRFESDDGERLDSRVGAQTTLADPIS